MKIRVGFISNSSNTSFYLMTESLEQAVKIMAEAAMIDYFKEKIQGQTKKDILIWLERLEKINTFFRQNSNYNEPVKLPYTCNNDTIIWDDGGGNGYAVDTCNNTEWYDYIEGMIRSSSELYFEGSEYFDLDEMKLVKR